MANVIKTMRKSGEFMADKTILASVEPYTLRGSYGTDNDGNLFNVNGGTVLNGETVKANFNVNVMNGQFRYNITDVTDMSELGAIGAAVEATVEKLAAELSSNK